VVRRKGENRKEESNGPDLAGTPAANARAVMQNETAGRVESVRETQADALFASGLQRRADPTAGQVRQAVAVAIGAFGCSGCAGRVAQEFGDHPETAVIRMRWARSVTRQVYADSAPESGPRAGAGPWPVARPRLPAEQASGSPVGLTMTDVRRGD